MSRHIDELIQEWNTLVGRMNAQKSWLNNTEEEKTIDADYVRFMGEMQARRDDKDE